MLNYNTALSFRGIGSLSLQISQHTKTAIISTTIYWAPLAPLLSTTHPPALVISVLYSQIFVVCFFCSFAFLSNNMLHMSETTQCFVFLLLTCFTHGNLFQFYPCFKKSGHISDLYYTVFTFKELKGKKKSLKWQQGDKQGLRESNACINPGEF